MFLVAKMLGWITFNSSYWIHNINLEVELVRVDELFQFFLLDSKEVAVIYYVNNKLGIFQFFLLDSPLSTSSMAHGYGYGTFNSSYWILGNTLLSESVSWREAVELSILLIGFS